jgi:hypothetical protein
MVQLFLIKQLKPCKNRFREISNGGKHKLLKADLRIELVTSHRLIMSKIKYFHQNLTVKIKILQEQPALQLLLVDILG